jgi:hypothetical protein
MSTFIATALLCLLSAQSVLAADCSIATVGQPHSNCWDIAVCFRANSESSTDTIPQAAALINVDQLKQYNPGLDCNFLALNQTLCVTPGKIPSSGPPPNDDGSCVTYTVCISDVYPRSVPNVSPHRLMATSVTPSVPILESRPLRSKSSTRMSVYFPSLSVLDA